MTIFTEAWGFSKLDVFRSCKAKFKYQFMEKLPQGSSPAMERGSKMHEVIESYLNGWITTLAPEVENWKEQLDELKTKNFRTEQALGFDNKWEQLENWFQPTVWLRVKMDAYYITDDKITVIDFKSGKFRKPSTEQVELYALAGFAMHPQMKESIAEMWYLDTGDVFRKVYTADQVPALQLKYEAYVKPMYSETQWAPAPSMECRWCPYSKTKGGKCKY